MSQDPSRVPPRPHPRRGRGESAVTPLKDERVPPLIHLAAHTAWRVTQRWQGYPAVCVIDTTAGYGVDPHTSRRSTIVLGMRAVAARGIPVDLYLCERDWRRYAVLEPTVRRLFAASPTLRVNCYGAEVATQMPTILATVAERARLVGKGCDQVYGALLADACGLLPWPALRAAHAVCPRLCLVLNVSATTIKRNRAALGLASLAQEVDSFGKEHCYIGRPHGAWQWTPLVLSDVPYRASQVGDLVDRRSREGQRRWDLITQTTRAGHPAVE